MDHYSATLKNEEINSLLPLDESNLVKDNSPTLSTAYQDLTNVLGTDEGLESTYHELLKEKPFREADLVERRNIILSKLGLFAQSLQLPIKEESETEDTSVLDYFQKHKKELGYSRYKTLKAIPSSMGIQIYASMHENDRDPDYLDLDNVKFLNYISFLGYDVTTLPPDVVNSMAQEVSYTLTDLMFLEADINGIDKDCVNTLEDSFKKRYLQLLRDAVEGVAFDDFNAVCQKVEDTILLLGDYFIKEDSTFKDKVYTQLRNFFEATKTRSNPADRERYFALIRKVSPTFYKSFVPQFKEETFRDWQALNTMIFHLDGSDLSHIRQDNWQRVSAYIRSMHDVGSINIEDLRTINKLSSEGILPSFCTGFRSDYKGYNFENIRHSFSEAVLSISGNKIEALGSDDLGSWLENYVENLNELLEKEKSPILFDFKLASAVAEYFRVHPHSDGNGTMMVFVADMMRTMKGLKDVTVEYPMNFQRRIKQVFGNYNPAILSLFMKWQQIRFNAKNIEAVS